MSLESFNPENRTIVNMPSRAQTLINIIRSRRCCSYCHQQGHTIRTCNDNSLVNFENECQIKKTEFTIETQLNINLSKNLFKCWLLCYATNGLSIMKAYSISKCRATLSDDVADIIDKITRHIYEVTSQELDDLPPLIDAAEADNGERTGNGNEDFIPFQASSTQEVTQEVNDNDIRLFMAITTMLNLNNNNVTNPNLLRELYYSAIVQAHLNNQKYTSIKIITSPEELSVKKNNEDLYTTCECNICYESIDKYKFVTFNCNHEFCKDCVIKTIKSTDSYKEPCCAFCRTAIDTIKTKSDEVKAELDHILN